MGRNYWVALIVTITAFVTPEIRCALGLPSESCPIGDEPDPDSVLLPSNKVCRIPPSMKYKTGQECPTNKSLFDECYCNREKGYVINYRNN